MSKFLRSLTDGSLRCKYCGDKECNCMEDGMTTIRIIGCWEFPDSPWSILVQPAKQTLPNGKKIPSGHKIWIPKDKCFGIDSLLKKMGVDNSFLNKLRFD